MFLSNFDIIIASQNMFEVNWSESCSVVSNSLQSHGLSPWNSPGLDTGVGDLSLLQGIFPTQGLNPCLLHCRRFLYQLSHKGSSRIPEWVAYPFFSRNSQPRNQIGVSCISDGLFTNWAMREAPENMFIFVTLMLFCEGTYMDLREIYPLRSLKQCYI